MEVSRTRTCTKCKQEKTVPEDFYSAYQRNGKTTYSGKCKACSNAIQAKRQQNPERHQYMQEYVLRTKYGLSIEQYEAMFEQQGGLCMICELPESRKTHPPAVNRLCVDHCSATGRVRGLLCHRCNVAIGQLDHDPKRVSAALQYLTNYT